MPNDPDRAGVITTRGRPIDNALRGRHSGQGPARRSWRRDGLPPEYRNGTPITTPNPDYTAGTASQLSPDALLVDRLPNDPYEAMRVMEKELGIVTDAIGGVLGRLAEQEKAAAEKGASSAKGEQNPSNPGQSNPETAPTSVVGGVPPEDTLRSLLQNIGDAHLNERPQPGNTTLATDSPAAQTEMPAEAAA